MIFLIERKRKRELEGSHKDVHVYEGLYKYHIHPQVYMEDHISVSKVFLGLYLPLMYIWRIIFVFYS